MYRPLLTPIPIPARIYWPTKEPVMLMPCPFPLTSPIRPRISKLRKVAYCASIMESVGTTIVRITKKNRILLPLNFSLAKE